MRVTPQPELRLHRETVGSGIGSTVLRRLFILILLVVPRHSCLHLIKVNIFAVRQQNLADQPSVGSFILAVEVNGLAGKQLGQVLSRLRSKRLIVLGSVDPRKTNG